LNNLSQISNFKAGSKSLIFPFNFYKNKKDPHLRNIYLQRGDL
jgi:hypothetical protein